MWKISQKQSLSSIDRYVIKLLTWKQLMYTSVEILILFKSADQIDFSAFYSTTKSNTIRCVSQLSNLHSSNVSKMYLSFFLHCCKYYKKANTNKKPNAHKRHWRGKPQSIKQKVVSLFYAIYTLEIIKQQLLQSNVNRQ